MNRSTEELIASQQVNSFLQRHLNPIPGRPAEDTRERILHWLAVANNPSQFTTDRSLRVIANVRRKARQNVRRLLLRHPSIAAQIAPEVSR